MFQKFYLYSVDRFPKKMSEEQGKESRVLADIILKAGFQHADFSASADFYACADFSAYPHRNFNHNANC